MGDRIEDITFTSGFLGSTVIKGLDFLNMDVVNEFLYAAVLIITIMIGLKKLLNKDKKK